MSSPIQRYLEASEALGPEDNAGPPPTIDHPEILTQELTCEGCPEQHEGVLTSGLLFYFRYRRGRAFLGVAPTEDGALMGTEPQGTGASMAVGDDLQGVFSNDRQRNDTFAALLDRIYH